MMFISTLLSFSNTYKQHQTYPHDVCMCDISLLFLEIDEPNTIWSKYFQ